MVYHDFPAKSYDDWKTTPPEKKRPIMAWGVGKRGKKRLRFVSDEDLEIQAGDDRLAAEKEGQ